MEQDLTFPDTNAQDSIASQVRSLALYPVHKNNIVKRLAMASSVQFARENNSLAVLPPRIALASPRQK